MPHQKWPKSVRIRSARSPATQSSARVVKLVDTRDLKSLDFTVVPVRFRLRAPINFLAIILNIPYI